MSRRRKSFLACVFFNFEIAPKTSSGQEFANTGYYWASKSLSFSNWSGLTINLVVWGVGLIQIGVPNRHYLCMFVSNLQSCVISAQEWLHLVYFLSSFVFASISCFADTGHSYRFMRHSWAFGLSFLQTLCCLFLAFYWLSTIIYSYLSQLIS